MTAHVNQEPVFCRQWKATACAGIGFSQAQTQVGFSNMKRTVQEDSSQ